MATIGKKKIEGKDQHVLYFKKFDPQKRILKRSQKVCRREGATNSVTRRHLLLKYEKVEKREIQKFELSKNESLSLITTIDEAINEFISHRKKLLDRRKIQGGSQGISIKTFDELDRSLRIFKIYCEINSIKNCVDFTREKAKRFRDWIEVYDGLSGQGLEMTSRNKILVNVKTFLNSFLDYDEPPFQSLERLIRALKRFKVDVGKPFHFTPSQLRTILTEAAKRDCKKFTITRESNKEGKRFTGELGLKLTPLLPQVLIALFTGMRKDDLLNLKWDNVDLELNNISYTAKKNNLPCVIPLADSQRTISPTLIDILKVWNDLRQSDPYVIAHPNAEKPVEWKRKISLFAQEAGVDELGYQNFRKTFESYAVSFGIEPAITAMWVAHSTATASKYYLRYAIGALSGNSIEEAMGLKSIMTKIYNGYLGKGEYKNLKLTKWSP